MDVISGPIVGFSEDSGCFVPNEASRLVLGCLESAQAEKIRISENKVTVFFIGQGN